MSDNGKLDLEGLEKRREFITERLEDRCWRCCETLLRIDVPALLARVAELEAQTALDAAVAARGRDLAQRPPVQIPNVRTPIAWCYYCGGIGEHEPGCEWAAFCAVLAARDAKAAQ